MENTALDSGTRVTRSLRKRLTSVDSENSSRPGTPISSKLSQIPEICASPSRSTRMTRRSSISGVATPVKTPAKRTVAALPISENLENITPPKRNTRRNEEDFQTELKKSKFTALDEEDKLQNDKKSQKIKIRNASPKKSQTPKENGNKEIKVQNFKSDTPKKRKGGCPKSKKRGHQEDVSDNEVSVLTSENEMFLNKSSNIATIVLADDDFNEIDDLFNEEKDLFNEENKIDNEKSTDVELSPGHSIKKATITMDRTEQEVATASNKEILEKSNDKISHQIISEEATTSSQLVEIKNVEKKNLNTFSVKIEQDFTVIENDPKCKEEYRRNLSFTKAECNIDSNDVDRFNGDNCITPEPKENSFLTKACKVSITKMDLVSSPMTPASLNNSKNSSLRGNDSFQAKSNSSQSKENGGVEEQNINVFNNNKQENINIGQTSTELNCEEKTNDLNCEENERNLSFTGVEYNKDSNEVNNFSVENCTTAEAKENVFQPDKVVILSNRTLSPGRRDDLDSNSNLCEASSTKVNFVTTPNHTTIKNVYPKTPFSTKTLNISKENDTSRNDDSFLAKDNSLAIHSDDRNNMSISKGIAESQTVETNEQPLPIAENTSVEGEEIVSEKHLNESKKILLEEIKETDEPKSSPNKISDNNENNSPNQNKEELKWINPCVKGTTDSGSKLDVVMQDSKNTSDCCDNANYVRKQIQTNKMKSISFSYDDEDELAAEEEDSYQQQNDYIIDEAIEVDDYASGDSMDSEERREIDENEVPIDGESIGSHTTEETQEEIDEEDGSDDADSFIVSDNEVSEGIASDRKDLKIDDGGINDSKRKKTFKRILHVEESSSSSDEEEELDDNELEKLQSHNKISTSQPQEEKMVDEVQSDSNSSESIFVDSILPHNSDENINSDGSKLSDLALRLQCSAESECEEVENNAVKINASRKEILRSFNQSDCFNKSVRDLNQEMNTTLTENIEEHCSTIQKPEIIQENNISSNEEEHTTSTSPDESAEKTLNDNKNKQMQSESHLEELSVSPESDVGKEKKQKSNTGLSVSFGNRKKRKEKQEWQRSFTIDVTVKGEELETAVSEVKLMETSSTSSPPSDGPENENSKCLKPLRNMPLPLGNPLKRTRRQSLALPTNPDMEICSSSNVSGTDKKTNRKSLGVLSSIDFKPSQSFIDSKELQRSDRLVGKRKRLSKSFCGASESLDNSTVDIDLCHLNKKFKLVSENSVAESEHNSTENINSSKLFTKLSSTPYEKINKNDSFKKNRILERCDQILEAANLAKLEAKIRNKKNKAKKPSKKVKVPISISPEEIKPDDVLRRISKDINHKEKTKAAVSKAIKAADVMLVKKKKTHSDVVTEEAKLEVKRLAPDVLKAIGGSVASKKKCKNEKLNNQERNKNANHASTSTSAGSIRELPQSPEKKNKKPSYIQLSTGTVSVEPVTPKKRAVQALKGMEFRESPITPSAVGFKVRKISPPANNVLPSSTLVEKKIKRHHLNEKETKCSSAKSQWTQSGFFIEENIPKNFQISCSGTTQLSSGSQKGKKRLPKREEHNVPYNFKENAIMRSDITRSNKREILLLKQRRHILGHY